MLWWHRYIRTIDSAPLERIYQLQSRPPLLERGQIVLNYVPAGVKVSIKGVTTMLTDKVRLVSSVRTGNISAFTAFLRGVACIYIDHSYPLSLSFILYKLLELSKVPAMYPAPILLVGFYSLPDPLELLKDNYSTSRNKIDYLLSYLVVNSSPKPFLLLRKSSKMSLCRRSAFGLQSLAKRKILFRNCSYVSPIKELINFSVRSRNYRKFTESKVNSNEVVNRFYIGKFLFNGNVEEKLLEPLIILEVGRSSFPVKVLPEIIRDFHLKLLPPLYGGKGNFFSIQPNSIGTLIITDSRIVAFRTLTFESFLLSLDCRLKALGSYNSCRNNKLRRKRGLISKRVVSKLMELHSVPELCFPTDFASVVVSKLVLFNGLKEYSFLSFGGIKNELKGSLQFHIHILLQYPQTFKCGLLPSLTEGISDRRKKRGNPSLWENPKKS